MNLLPETAMQRYIDLRDKRSALKKAFEEKDDALKAFQDKIEAWLLKKMQELGSDTIKNDAGTAYITVKSRFSCADWPGLWQWLQENKRVDMLEKRISSKAVQEFEEENGALPPFLNVSKEREVSIRRA